jgi:hypothetical protein
VASRTITTLTDDIDGGDADETVTFSFKGTQYEIDLSKKNVDKTVKALQPDTSAPGRAAAAAPAPAGLPAAAPMGTSWRTVTVVVVAIAMAPFVLILLALGAVCLDALIDAVPHGR